MIIYLILSVVLSSFFAGCYKLAAYKRCNLSAVNLWMYVSATTTIGVFMILKQSLDVKWAAVFLGASAGVSLFAGTLSFFHHMKRGTLSVSWTVLSLTIFFPVIASVLFWNEHPTPKQGIGLLLMLAALILFGFQEAGGGKDRA